MKNRPLVKYVRLMVVIHVHLKRQIYSSITTVQLSSCPDPTYTHKIIAMEHIADMNKKKKEKKKITKRTWKVWSEDR